METAPVGGHFWRSTRRSFFFDGVSHRDCETSKAFQFFKTTMEEELRKSIVGFFEGGVSLILCPCVDVLSRRESLQ